MAKIDVSSTESIFVLDNATLKVGERLLSFSDLVREGYTIRIERPALAIDIGDANESVLNETLIVNETVIINETLVENITEVINESVLNESVLNESVLNESVIVNETLVENITEVVNESVEVVNGGIEEGEENGSQIDTTQGVPSASGKIDTDFEEEVIEENVSQEDNRY